MSAMKMIASAKFSLQHDMTVLQGVVLNRGVENLAYDVCQFGTVCHVWHAFIHVSSVPVSSVCRIFFVIEMCYCLICHNGVFSLDEQFEHNEITSKLEISLCKILLLVLILIVLLFLYLNSVKILKYIKFA